MIVLVLNSADELNASAVQFLKKENLINTNRVFL